jgi:beta-lactamase superfamily II metal-dependent hydrolase
MAWLPVHDGLLQIFNVRHGACALLTMPSPTGVRRILIDCGHSNSGGVVLYPGRHLRALNVNHIDALFSMNYDEDHASGFPDLLKQGVTIGSIYGNPSVPPSTVRHLKTEDGMGPGIDALTNALAIRKQLGIVETLPVIPGLEIRACWNCYPAFDDENNLSLALELRILGFSFLFTGDMEKDGLTHLLTHYPPFREMVARTTVLNASHHGRANGVCQNMFDQYGCSPALVVISDDYKQYESQETTNYYKSKARGYAGFRGEDMRFVLTTRNDGEIVFSFRNGSCFAE